MFENFFLASFPSHIPSQLFDFAHFLINALTRSLYLYLKHPDLSVGQLVKRRQNLVKNHFLQELAAKLDLENYGLYNIKHHLTQMSLRHFSGNCIETILGAIFLDGGAEEARRLFGRLAFSEVGTYSMT